MNLTVDVVDPVDRNKMPFAISLWIVLAQTDAGGSLHVINCANVLAIRTYHFHVFLDVQRLQHAKPPLIFRVAEVQRRTHNSSDPGEPHHSSSANHNPRQITDLKGRDD